MSASGKPLKARMEDLALACDHYGFAAGDLLSEEEQLEAGGYLRALQKTVSFDFLFYGGVGGAERKIALLFDRSYGKIDPSDFSDITSIKLVATDKSIPGHRAVLGSILALGIERKMIGDIFPFENGVAVIVKERILPYIQKELDKVGQSRVEIFPCTIPGSFEIQKEMEELTLSVASLRLDCMVAAILKCSREDAADAIAVGRVQVNHKEISRPDFKLSEHSTISIKGKGRFIFDHEEGNTKSGRLRIKILRFI